MSRGPAIGLFALLGVVVTVAVASVNAADRRTIPSDVVQAINLSCATYGSCADLWRKASCETGGTFSPTARNPVPVGGEHAVGLFQFLPSTWKTTPYRMFSPMSPFASALAAGWMHSVGRGNEWSCR